MEHRLQTSMREVRRGAVASLIALAAPLAVAQSWVPARPMPTPRTFAGAGAVDGKLFVLAGDQNVAAPLAAEVYDPATRTWSEIAPVPDPYAAGRWAPIVEVVDGRLFVIGGLYDQTSTYEYDPASDSWISRGLDNPGGIWDENTVTGVIDGRIWIVVTGYVLKPVVAWDPRTQQTEQILAHTGDSRYSTQGGAIDGKIYLAGGYVPGESPPVIADVDFYDTATGTWGQVAPMITPRWYAGDAVIDGKLYIVGGVTWDEAAAAWRRVPTVEIYDPETDTWTETRDAPIPRVGAAVAGLDGKLYAVGGEKYPQLAGQPFLDATYVLDPRPCGGFFPCFRGKHVRGSGRPHPRNRRPRVPR